MAKEFKAKNQYTPKKDEEYMSEAQLAHFTRLLEDWKNEILTDSDRTKEHLRDERAPTADLNDRATQEEEFSLELRTRDRERKLLHKIDAGPHRPQRLRLVRKMRRRNRHPPPGSAPYRRTLH